MQLVDDVPPEEENKNSDNLKAQNKQKVVRSEAGPSGDAHIVYACVRA